MTILMWDTKSFPLVAPPADQEVCTCQHYSHLQDWKHQPTGLLQLIMAVIVFYCIIIISIRIWGIVPLLSCTSF